MPMKKIIFKAILIGIGVLVFANMVILSYSRFIVKDTSALPYREVALIFGGGMEEDGSMNKMQTDRVIRGIELYKSGKVDKLMMTGDDGFHHDDEVGAMKAYAVQAGVPAEDILVDPHGYRTYESCYRERVVYGMTSTIAISQSFHLPRIAYLCSRIGIKTTGVSADLRDYNWKNSYYSNIREVLARLKAVWQVEITRPQPTSLEK